MGQKRRLLITAGRKIMLPLLERKDEDRPKGGVVVLQICSSGRFKAERSAILCESTRTAVERGDCEK